jgi:probable rRNA maturation factor
MQKIYFLNNDRSPVVRHKKLLKPFIEKLFLSERSKLERLTYVFCSDKFLLDMNRRFLSHDYFTDVITFDLTEHGGSTTGEIYISVDRVKDNAGMLGISFSKELHRVLFHGALHLCGYEDKTKKGIEEMRKREDHYLKKYFK